jgi:enoyl-CoA hydratase/carnithine racemase
MAVVTTETQGPVVLIGVNRPEKANAWDADVIAGVAAALGSLRDDDALRAGVIFGHGRHFTAGLDLASVAPVVASGDGASLIPPGLPDPWGVVGEPCPKPVVVAAHGRCNTLGIELILASGLAVCAPDTRFAQLEVARGIVPLGGATFRLPQQFGSWGLRHLLSAEEFDADEAARVGLVLEVTPEGAHVERALDLATSIAANAPLGVQAALANARVAGASGRAEAAAHLASVLPDIMNSADAAEGMAAMIEKRDATFSGH